MGARGDRIAVTCGRRLTQPQGVYYGPEAFADSAVRWGGGLAGRTPTGSRSAPSIPHGSLLPLVSVHSLGGTHPTFPTMSPY